MSLSKLVGAVTAIVVCMLAGSSPADIPQPAQPEMIYDVARYVPPLTDPLGDPEFRKAMAVNDVPVVHELVDTTPLSDFDERAAEVYADNTGKFWSQTIIGAAPYAGQAIVDWTQWFTKDTDDAFARFTVSGARLDLDDGNPLGYDPWVMKASLMAIAGRSNTSGLVVNTQQAEASMEGNRGLDDSAFTYSVIAPATSTPEYQHFDNLGVLHTTGLTVKIDPFTMFVPLGDLAVGDQFFIHYQLSTFALGEGQDSSANAYVYDPLDPSSGVQLETSGLSPIPAVPLPEPASLLQLAGMLAVLAVRWRPQRRVRR